MIDGFLSAAVQLVKTHLVHAGVASVARLEDEVGRMLTYNRKLMSEQLTLASEQQATVAVAQQQDVLRRGGAGATMASPDARSGHTPSPRGTSGARLFSASGGHDDVATAADLDRAMRATYDGKLNGLRTLLARLESARNGNEEEGDDDDQVGSSASDDDQGRRGGGSGKAGPSATAASLATVGRKEAARNAAPTVAADGSGAPERPRVSPSQARPQSAGFGRRLTERITPRPSTAGSAVATATDVAGGASSAAAGSALVRPKTAGGHRSSSASGSDDAAAASSPRRPQTAAPVRRTRFADDRVVNDATVRAPGEPASHSLPGAASAPATGGTANGAAAIESLVHKRDDRAAAHAAQVAAAAAAKTGGWHGSGGGNNSGHNSGAPTTASSSDGGGAAGKASDVRAGDDAGLAAVESGSSSAVQPHPHALRRQHGGIGGGGSGDAGNGGGGGGGAASGGGPPASRESRAEHRAEHQKQQRSGERVAEREEMERAQVKAQQTRRSLLLRKTPAPGGGEGSANGPEGSGGGGATKDGTPRATMNTQRTLAVRRSSNLGMPNAGGKGHGHIAPKNELEARRIADAVSGMANLNISKSQRFETDDSGDF